MEKRRNAFQRHAGALIGAICFCGAAQACELPSGRRLETERVALSYRTEPSKIVVGEHFALELAVCRKQKAEIRNEINLDAHMPEHRHGMNYRPSVSALGSGRFRSEGWLFHMPGRWEFVFELGSERLADSVLVE